jgi:S1-C subfamily serine protease
MKYFTFTLLLMFSVATSSFGQASAAAKPPNNSPSASIEGMRNSIVQVSAKGPEIDGYLLGSGFLVAPQYVVTNCHVVGLCRSSPLLTNPTVMVAFRIPSFSIPHTTIQESFQAMTVQVVGSDLENDLTLLKLPDDVETRVRAGVYMGPGAEAAPHIQITWAQLSDVIPCDGTEIFLSGFPLRQPSLVTQRGIVASAVMRADIPLLDATEEDSDIILLDATINHGNSGGPVYLAGYPVVIGVAEAFVPAENQIASNGPSPKLIPYTAIANSGLGVVIPIKYVIALMKKYSVHLPDAIKKLPPKISKSSVN